MAPRCAVWFGEKPHRLNPTTPLTSLTDQQVGILSRGLLPPKVVVSQYGGATGALECDSELMCW